MARQHVPRKCPINQAACGHDCFLRHHCQHRPEQVTALLALLDPQTTVAISRLVTARRPRLKHVTQAA